MRDLIVRPAANADITDATLWYEAKSAGLGSEFLRAADACLSEIQRIPGRFPLVHKSMRRALMRRFPYAMYFIERDNDVVAVIACMHAHREPRRWQERADG